MLNLVHFFNSHLICAGTWQEDKGEDSGAKASWEADKQQHRQTLLLTNRKEEEHFELSYFLPFFLSPSTCHVTGEVVTFSLQLHVSVWLTTVPTRKLLQFNVTSPRKRNIRNHKWNHFIRWAVTSEAFIKPNYWSWDVKTCWRETQTASLKHINSILEGFLQLLCETSVQSVCLKYIRGYVARVVWLLRLWRERGDGHTTWQGLRSPTGASSRCII